MAAAAGLYQERLLKQNMLDFDDMTLWSIVVVHEHEEMREKHQQQFGHLRVDETATTCSWWVTPTGPFDGARRIDLDTTYRSTKNILEGGERAHPAGERAHPLQKVAERAPLVARIADHHADVVAPPLDSLRLLAVERLAHLTAEILQREAGGLGGRLDAELHLGLAGAERVGVTS